MKHFTSYFMFTALRPFVFAMESYPQQQLHQPKKIIISCVGVQVKCAYLWTNSMAFFITTTLQLLVVVYFLLFYLFVRYGFSCLCGAVVLYTSDSHGNK